MSEALARAAYALLLRLATPAYLLRLWWRGRKEPGYRQHLGERLGFFQGQPVPDRLWLHAVSLGETRAAAPLIEALRSQRPGLKLLLTHGTATGREAGRALLREGDAQAWLPYDTPGAVRRFLRTHRPLAGVIMETEVWPNLTAGAKAEGVSLLLANARLSERSRRKGERLRALMHPALARFTQVLAQTEGDAMRLRDSGATAVRVLGNLKFDMSPRPDLLARGKGWHTALSRPVLLAAATREGEEGPLLRAFSDQIAGRPQPVPLLLMVPRHPQRFDEVAAGIAAAGFELARRSQWSDMPGEEALRADVWLGDSLGEMPLYYACADAALLGGSFAPLGGQNLIEAAACGCPLVMGPHTFNFADAAELSIAAGAGERVADIEAGVARALAIAQEDAMSHAQRVRRALAFAGEHRGAAERLAQAILARLPAA